MRRYDRTFDFAPRWRLWSSLSGGRTVAVAGLAWLLAVGLGFAVLLDYKTEPGEAATPAGEWPRVPELELARDRATLVMFAHPLCACTRASLTELRALLPRLRPRPAVFVVFLRPEDAPDSWKDSELHRLAASIPDVTVVSDAGAISTRFGAVTSGTTVLYDAAGTLLFHGGLTSSRGHEGDSFGQQRLLAIVNGTGFDRDTAPVFGCPLDDPDTRGERP